MVACRPGDDQVSAVLPAVNTLHNSKKHKREISTPVMWPVALPHDVSMPTSGHRMAQPSSLPVIACQPVATTLPHVSMPMPTSGGMQARGDQVSAALPAVAVKVKQPARPLGGKVV